MKARAQKASLEEDVQSLEAFRKIPLSEMNQLTVDFRDKYRGQSYLKAYQDSRWAEWFVSTYTKSSKPAHQKFLIFVEATGCRNRELSKPGQDESQWKQNDLIQDQDPCEGVSRSQSDRVGQCVRGRNAM